MTTSMQRIRRREKISSILADEFGDILASRIDHENLTDELRWQLARRAADVAVAIDSPPVSVLDIAEERDRFRVALETIKRERGGVCESFEICTHRACRDSHGAWEIADAALAGGEQS